MQLANRSSPEHRYSHNEDYCQSHFEYVAKHGLIPILKKVGDIAVGVTKSKKDDEAWAKIKRVIDDLDG